MQENSKLSIHNYEEHIVNYLDGKLNPVEAAELFLFLEMHPELNEDLDELAEMTIEPDLDIVYDFKDALKLSYDADAQQISSKNYLFYFTAFTEGDLSQKGMDNVKRFIDQNPTYENELLLLQNCRIEPSQSIVYPNKSELKKKQGILIPIVLRWAALAASLLILFSVYLRLEPTTTESLNQILAKTETPDLEKHPQEGVKNNPENKGTQQNKQANSNPQDKKAAVKEEKKQARPTTSDKEERTTHKEERTPTLPAMPSLRNTMNYTRPFDGAMRQTYSSLFEDISLSQQIMLAYAENHSTEDTQNEPRIAFNVGRRFNQYLQTGTQVASQVSESFSGWMLADVGIKGINLLTDKNLRLVREVQQNGTTGDVMLKSEDVSYMLKRADR